MCVLAPHSFCVWCLQALQAVRRVRPAADPNEGFQAQLDLFAEMRCSLDPEHPVYRMWCIEQVWEPTPQLLLWRCAVSAVYSAWAMHSDPLNA